MIYLRSLYFFIFTLLTIMAPARGFSFSEMIRNGYPQCIACHYSPTGGGILTNYGRQISKDLLSSWSKKNEARYLYLFKSPSWLALGGHFRAMGLSTQNSGVTTNRYIPMQRDLEFAAHSKKWVLDSTIGYRDPVAPETDNWTSRRHFVLYKISDSVSLRGGRFYPAFGIYIPEHFTFIRRALGWDESRETYNLEFSFMGESTDLFVTGIFGRPDFPGLYREIGGSLSGGLLLGDRYKIGFSYYYGGSDLWTHHYFGPYGVLGFTSRFYLLSQVDGVRGFSYTFTDPQWGLVDYQKLGYEIFRGFHLFVAQEVIQLDLKNNSTRTDAYTAGIQFFPRPHFDFQSYWQRRTSAATSINTDTIGLMAHFYP